MADTNMKEIMAKIHEALANELLDRVMSGEATPSDLNVCRQFLKDNGIDAIAREGSPLHQLGQILPFQDPQTPISKAAGE